MTTIIDNQPARKKVADGVEQSRAVASSPSTPQSLYVKHTKLYPKLAHGFYRNIKWFALFILLGIYYITPWIRWNRGPGQPSQAVLVDFENARFYFFFIEIWPQEVYYITGLLILAALGLFLATSLFGRVWCGYACPQTIWTDLFIQVEKFFEGDRNACTYMCPWPRIQAAMIDEEALNVTYRYDRGEPRGAHKKGSSWDGRGDCIDCRQCVAVCPVGIDIRDGLQLECIGCSLCIDACDEIMVKIDRPKGLIAFDTDANVQRRIKGEPSRFNLVRARTVIYGVLFAVVGSMMLYALLTRSTLDMNVLRDRQPNYVQLSDGAIRNGYTIKVLNKATRDRLFTIEIAGLPGPVISIAGQGQEVGNVLAVPADETMDFKVYVAESDISGLNQKTDFNFVLRDVGSDDTTSSRAIFISKGPK